MAASQGQTAGGHQYRFVGSFMGKMAGNESCNRNNEKRPNFGTAMQAVRAEEVCRGDHAGAQNENGMPEIA